MKLLRCASLGIVAVLALAGCHKKEETRQQGMAHIDVVLPEIDSVTLHRTFPGYIDASSSAKVVARVSGQVMSLNYVSGSLVTKGQVLMRIEDTKYRDAVGQAQAALATAQSQRDYYAKQNEAVQKALKSGAVAQIEADQVESNLRQAEAAIKNAQAALETANTNLSYCTVRAPITGHITNTPYGQGNYVDGEGAAVVVATIYADEVMEAVFNIESSQYQKLIGANGGFDAPVYRDVPITFDADMQHSYTTDLYYSSPAVDQTTGTIAMRGYVKNPYDELKKGMYVNVDLPYGTEPQAILIKDASIGTDQLGKFVYVVNDSNTVVYTPIQVGELYHDTLRIVNSGLKPTDRYVTKALLTVRNGETVEPVLTK